MSFFDKRIHALVPELIFVDMLGRKAGTEVATLRVESVDGVWTRPRTPHIVMDEVRNYSIPNFMYL
jgi:hypothetical protein